jgi:hypothetical protein
VAQKPDRTNAIQPVLNVFRTRAGLQNAVTTEPFVEMSRMSNQWKAEFTGDIFHMRSFWKGHGELSQKTYYIQVGMICRNIVLATGRVSDCRNSLITNRLEPFIRPSKSGESCFPKRYSRLLEFWPIPV